MLSKLALISAVLSAAHVSAYTSPSFKGPLLIQPGVNTGKCLRADNKNGASVEVTSCTGSSDQEWTFGPKGAVSLYNGAKCLDVTDGKNADGTKLQVWDCGSGNPNQEFSYTKFGDNHIQWTKGKCVDLTGGSLATGNKIQIWSCNGNEDNNNQIWDTGYIYNKLPSKSETGQFGTNACGTTSSQTSNCQTIWMNDADDFCLWAPPSVGTIGDTERNEVAWCTKSGRGTRVMPKDTLKGVHFVRTKDYVQVTGNGDLTKINVKKGDEGGELDPHGSDSNGNPIGGLVFGNTFGSHLQYAEWTSFISATQFCMRACTGLNARENCQHTYDEMGCDWNMPANYNSGTFESCKADNDLPMGVYGTSTWHQGTSPTPAAHPVAKSSSCTPFPSITPAAVKRDYSAEKLVKRVHHARATPAPIF
ncbi:carbohydrate-binding module family 13 protein [Piloderma croceum F 1598]|uniref:Carbohydrate-binding module family 13 protein n=1 Tax=Piloderma croceum (strain F 1598) TaxID=765440 RepID=A0A0C3EVY1_PILCF|nr:carbohydrate-binding module family 13 protein [Piloderma croceum F 1598]